MGVVDARKVNIPLPAHVESDGFRSYLGTDRCALSLALLRSEDN